MGLRPRHQTLLIVGFAAAAILSVAVVAWRNSRVSTSPESLLLRLPTQDAVVAGVDVDTLRRSGFLDALFHSKTPQEAEYTAFVRDTGFDYTRDLDSLLVSFSPDGEFFLAKGTFDWPKLERYAASQKGSCTDHFCRVNGSTADRKISFFPLRHDLMAMAVAPDESAASRLRKAGPQADIAIPAQPLWLSFSSGALRHATSLPDSSKLFASAITDATRVTVTIGPSGSDAEARLDAVCRDAPQAGSLMMQLRALTTLLRNGAERQGKAIAADDFAGLLTSGTFEQAGSHVVGRWPVKRALLANLASGI